MKLMRITTEDASAEIEDLRQEMRREIANNSDFKAFLLEKTIDESFFNSYLSSIHACMLEREHCGHCPNLESCQNENEGYCLDLSRDDEYLKKSFKPCGYYINNLLYMHAFIRADIKLDASLNLNYLKGLLPDNKNRQEAYDLLSDRLQENTRWVYMMGQAKADKTRFAEAFVNDYLKKYPRRKIAFANFAKLVSDMSEIVFSQKELFKQKMDELINCDVLILDDFGSGYINNVIRDSFVLPLINERNKLGKLIIFTSRFSIKDAVTLILGQMKLLINTVGGSISVASDRVLLTHELM